MCTGMELALVAATGIQAGSAIMQGQQQKDMYEYQAAQADADAETARQAGEIKAERIRKKARSVAASTRAALAAKGLSVSGETSNLINKDIAEQSELDAILGIDDANSAASRLRADASLDRLRGSSAQTAGFLNAGSSALATYGQYKAGWYGSK